jgi:hypothetical protein
MEGIPLLKDKDHEKQGSGLSFHTQVSYNQPVVDKEFTAQAIALGRFYA